MQEDDLGRGVPRRWCTDSAYLNPYNALEDEFSLAKAMSEARACEPDAGAVRGAYGHDANGDRAARRGRCRVDRSFFPKATSAGGACRILVGFGAGKR